MAVADLRLGRFFNPPIETVDGATDMANRCNPVEKGAGRGSSRRAIGYRICRSDKLREGADPCQRAQNHARVDYERLEFLGDRVLGLCVAELLFETFPEAAAKANCRCG